MTSVPKQRQRVSTIMLVASPIAILIGLKFNELGWMYGVALGVIGLILRFKGR